MSEVVLSHALQAIGFGLSGVVVMGAVQGWLTGFTVHLGFVAVGLFMALSAYLVIGSLDKNGNLRRYFWRRVKRTWPLYFGTCAVVFVLMDPNWTTLAYNVTFLAPWFPSHSFSVPFPVASEYVLWNLQIEEWAYLCFPLVAVLSGTNRKVVGAALVGGSVIGYALAQTGVTDYFLTYVSPYPWLICFGAGILAYEYRGNWSKWGPAAMGAMVLSVLLVPFPWVMVGSAPFAAWVVAYPPMWLRRITLVAVGEVSYGVYLVHMLFIDYLGPLGAFAGFGAGAGAEYLQRGREIARRVRETGVDGRPVHDKALIRHLNVHISARREPAAGEVH